MSNHHLCKKITAVSHVAVVVAVISACATEEPTMQAQQGIDWTSTCQDAIRKKFVLLKTEGRTVGMTVIECEPLKHIVGNEVNSGNKLEIPIDKVEQIWPGGRPYQPPTKLEAAAETVVLVVLGAPFIPMIPILQPFLAAQEKTLEKNVDKPTTCLQRKERATPA